MWCLAEPGRGLHSLGPALHCILLRRLGQGGGQVRREYSEVLVDGFPLLPLYRLACGLRGFKRCAHWFFCCAVIQFRLILGSDGGVVWLVGAVHGTPWVLTPEARARFQKLVLVGGRGWS